MSPRLGHWLTVTVLGLCLAACTGESFYTPIADPDPAALEGYWVNDEDVSFVAMVLNAPAPRTKAIHLQSGGACFVGNDALGFLARCNGRESTSVSEADQVCFWGVESDENGKYIGLVASNTSRSGPFLGLKVSLLSDPSGDLELYGLCRDKSDFFLMPRSVRDGTS